MESRGDTTISALRQLFTPPNLLSLFRIVLVPLIVVVLLTRVEGWDLIGLGLFLLAAATDFLDGFLARRRQMVTRLGKILDPAADKILVSAAFIALVELDLAPAWMVMVIIAREFAVSALRSLAAADGLVLAALVSAKIKTVLQIVAISLLIVSEQLGDFRGLGIVVLWLALAATIWSGGEYFVRYGPTVVRGDSARPRSGA